MARLNEAAAPPAESVDAREFSHQLGSRAPPALNRIAISWPSSANSQTPLRAPEPRTDKVRLSPPLTSAQRNPTSCSNKKTKPPAEQTRRNPSASAPSNSRPPASSPKTSRSAPRSSRCSTAPTGTRLAPAPSWPSRAGSRARSRNWAGWWASWATRRLRTKCCRQEEEEEEEEDQMLWKTWGVRGRRVRGIGGIRSVCRMWLVGRRARARHMGTGRRRVGVGVGGCQWLWRASIIPGGRWGMFFRPPQQNSRPRSRRVKGASSGAFHWRGVRPQRRRTRRPPRWSRARHRQRDGDGGRLPGFGPTSRCALRVGRSSDPLRSGLDARDRRPRCRVGCGESCSFRELGDAEEEERWGLECVGLRGCEGWRVGSVPVCESELEPVGEAEAECAWWGGRSGGGFGAYGEGRVRVWPQAWSGSCWGWCAGTGEQGG